MTPTICRSMWGHGQPSFYKTERDIVIALNTKRPIGRVYSYGQFAKHFLTLCNIEHQPLPDIAPPEYRLGAPVASMWWRKLLAIRQCAIDTGGPVLHMDWDTECDGKLPDMSKGPAFQGRLRWYSRPQCNHRPRGFTRIVYHGGCMYFRDLETIERAIYFHAKFSRQFADEAAVTQLADEIVGSHELEAHREAGCDNPAFYVSGRDAIASNVKAAFREGPRVKSETSIPYVSALIAAQINKDAIPDKPPVRKVYRRSQKAKRFISGG